MPFTGGYSPSPERYGGGEGNSDAPLMQRIVEGILATLGSAYTQNPLSAVGVQANAFARAIAFDVYGASQRLANEFDPRRMTAKGLLPRWEAILGLTVLPTDTEPVRRARVVARFLSFAQPNGLQPVIDAVKTALGPVYVALTTTPFANNEPFWPGLQGNVSLGNASAITAVSGNVATFSGIGPSLGNNPSAYYRSILTINFASNAVNNGQWLLLSVSSTTCTAVLLSGQTPISPDYGNGGNAGSFTQSWSIASPYTPWMSPLAHIDIQVQQPNGYTLAQFYAALGALAPLLDELLPAWVTWDWWQPSPTGGGAMGFFLDDPSNLDIEVFDT